MKIRGPLPEAELPQQAVKPKSVLVPSAIEFNPSIISSMDGSTLVVAFNTPTLFRAKVKRSDRVWDSGTEINVELTDEEREKILSILSQAAKAQLKVMHEELKVMHEEL
jgi:anti-sigma factor RsiW